MSCIILILLFAIVGVVLSAPQINKPEKIDKLLLKKILNKDCVTSYSIDCFKFDIVSWVEKLDRSEDLRVLPGISLVKENHSDAKSPRQIVSDLAREFPVDPGARLNAYLMRRISGFLGSHSIKLNLENTLEQLQGEARKRGGSDGGGKGGSGMAMILAGGAMMKGMLLMLSMSTMWLMAAKAVMTSIVSLLISASLGLKALFQHNKQESYKVIKAEPVIHDTHDFANLGLYNHAAYARSLDVKPLPLALQPGYKPAT